MGLKRFFIGIALVSGMLSCRPEDDSQLYGTAFDHQDASDENLALKGLQLGDTADVIFLAEVDNVCQVKGCWMTLKGDSGQSIRVTFKDYGFFVPKDLSGKKVIVKGIATLAELDENTAKHYAEDAGLEYDSTVANKKLSIIASGVMMVK